MNLTNSKALLERARKVIPDATHTYSKGHFMFPAEGVPFAIEGGDGAIVWDVDANEYIDWTAALCAMSLGYLDERVMDAVSMQHWCGNVFGLPSPIETAAAELFCELTGYDMVRFGKNGSDATTHAVRLARAVTGRDHILRFSGHYHGCADWAQSWNERCKGIPYEVSETIIKTDYGTLADYERLGLLELACVILEPVQTEPPPLGYLEALRKWCTAHGILLIFDEVITGFRAATGGWAQVSGVKPDLACFGKAMANGWPVSALTGKREYMERLGETFMSYTFGGEAVSLAACKATMQVYKERDVCKQLAENGKPIHDWLVARSTDYCTGREGMVPGMIVRGFPWRVVVKFLKADGTEDLVAKSVFLQLCFEHGIMTNGQFIPTLAHNKEITDKTCEAFRQIFNRMENCHFDYRKLLKGEPIKGAGVR